LIFIGVSLNDDQEATLIRFEIEIENENENENEIEQ
jgi:hypothetical protein